MKTIARSIVLNLLLVFPAFSFCQGPWVKAGSLSLPVQAFVTIGNNLFAGTSGGVYHSNNDGASWTLRVGAFPLTEILSMTSDGTNLYVGRYYTAAAPAIIL